MFYINQEFELFFYEEYWYVIVKLELQQYEFIFWEIKSKKFDLFLFDIFGVFVELLMKIKVEIDVKIVFFEEKNVKVIY